MALSRDDILGIADIATKEITVPEWNGSVFIKQLTRAEQDEYLSRQYGATKLRQNQRAKSQEIDGMNIYGHDAFLVACGVCDESGKRLFKPADIGKLKEKNGAVIGRLAVEIVKFSEMSGDVDMESELKN